MLIDSVRSCSILAVLLCLVTASHAVCCGPTVARISCPNKHYNQSYCNSEKLYITGRIPSNFHAYDCRDEFVPYFVPNRCEDGTKPTVTIGSLKGVCVDRNKPIDKSIGAAIWSGVSSAFIPGSSNICNGFGCDCNFECLEGPVKEGLVTCPAEGVEFDTAVLYKKRSLLSLSSNSTDTRERCFEEMFRKFGTTSLYSKDQIQEYFNCWDDDGDGVLSLGDTSVASMTNATEVIGEIDGNSNAAVDPPEFDSSLAERNESSSSCAFRKATVFVSSMLIVFL